MHALLNQVFVFVNTGYLDVIKILIISKSKFKKMVEQYLAEHNYMDATSGSENT